MTINIITLGCSKNIVDSEVLAAQLQKQGHQILFESAMRSDIVILNTCSFIGDAREESVDEILQQLERKHRGQVKKVYVVGCLAQRSKDSTMRTAGTQHRRTRRQGFDLFHRAKGR